jgi:hypothetical protein
MNADQFVSRPAPAPAPAEPAPALPAPPPSPAPHRNPWPLALVLLALILVVGGPFAYIAITWSNKVATAPARMLQTFTDAAAEAARPKLTMNEIVLNTISDVQKKQKLVVFETVVNADITREEGASSWGVYWGTNVARVAVKDARVQYVIDLDGLSTSNFVYNEEAKVLTIAVPRPHIDTTMVSIDPARIQTLDLRGGWARFDKQETRTNAIASLRPQVIAQAQAPFVQKLAAESGIEMMTQFLNPLAGTLSKEGAQVKIVYTQ